MSTGSATSPRRTPRLAIVALPQALASSVLGMLDAINLANAFALLEGSADRQIEARIVSQSTLEVEAFGGRPIRCDGLLDDSGRRGCHCGCAGGD